MNRRSDNPRIGRRVFLAAAAASAGGLCLRRAGGDAADDGPWVRKALHYTPLADQEVRCDLCPRACTVADMERGYCGVRQNRGGEYHTLVYARPCSVHPDPIEKKPFFHCLPGTKALSIATAGCNLECRFCQNWTISQRRPEQLAYGALSRIDAGPKGLVRLARRAGCGSIAYTYTEPTVFYEYMYESAREARKAGIGSVAVSNGYIMEKPLRALCKHLTAYKVDLKGFTETFYRDTCSAHLKPVLETLERLKDTGVWLEIVVLIIPTLNDGTAEIRRMCAWIRKNLGPDVPLHFSRFHPMYKLRNLPATPVRTLDRAWRIARDAGLHFVYVGNLPGHRAESTYCPGCARPVITRYGNRVIDMELRHGKCPRCGRAIPGVWGEA